MSISPPPIKSQSISTPILPLELAQNELALKKDFPSVTKLLAGLSFHDETHPDFLIRASRRKGKSPALRCSLLDPIALSSERRTPPALPVPPRASLQDASHSATQIAIFANSPCSPPSSTLTSPSGSSFSPHSPSGLPKSSLKRPRANLEDDCDCVPAGEALDSPPALDLRFNWQNKLDPWRPVIARPARVWLAPPVEEPGLGQDDDEEEDGHVLMVPRRVGVHQADKRRRESALSLLNRSLLHLEARISRELRGWGVGGPARMAGALGGQNKPDITHGTTRILSLNGAYDLNLEKLMWMGY